MRRLSVFSDMNLGFVTLESFLRGREADRQTTFLAEFQVVMRSSSLGYGLGLYLARQDTTVLTFCM
jgi:hypothetical protein